MKHEGPAPSGAGPLLCALERAAKLRALCERGAQRQQAHGAGPILTLSRIALPYGASFWRSERRVAPVRKPSSTDAVILHRGKVTASTALPQTRYDTLTECERERTIVRQQA